ncbi:hypothetical protein CEUSTIGMA_g5628.t1 [Chlamydomonas eustigma]|uniref:Major facilitator superfamily (MFS) profile domain-containing protein n=1 Tax=Chlamydomonas eustigma TaxID=1157962 RepID=A0A250X564_9CHLO|nr:hypothetical protein CEUSTIGMA_g5628.t1 [Chlamydomonas eustigma]|eukprot:GAX78186.1 hypothetical protein CEUSTIGMA_g5628.t1 [Chlamydomonas eustigma]
MIGSPSKQEGWWWRKRFDFRTYLPASYTILLSQYFPDTLGEADSNASQLPSPKHWFRVVCLCCTVAIINSMDRMAMSIAILPMSSQYHWSDTVKGAVSSAFNVGHMISNFMVGGYLASGWISSKTMLSWGVITWSLFTLLTPVAAGLRWLPLLILVRALMGLGEGVAFPTIQAIIKAWVPSHKRSRSLSLVFSGHQIGSIVSLLVSPSIIAATGTTALFYLYGALGFLWLSFWEPMIGNHPPKAVLSDPEDEAPNLSQVFVVKDPNTSPNTSPRGSLGGCMGKGGSTGTASSSASNVSNIKLALPASDIPWQLFLCNKCFWALLWSHSVFGIGYSTFIAWLPTYYSQSFGVDLRQSSWLSILPFLMMAIGTNASGWIADNLINKKIMTPSKARKLLQGIGNLGPAICLMYLAMVPKQSKGSLNEAVVLLTVSLMTLGMQSGGFASTHTDISTRYASALFGITNAGASLGGLVFVYLVGVILDSTKSWSLVFQLVAACNFSSAITFILFATSEPQFE